MNLMRKKLSVIFFFLAVLLFYDFVPLAFAEVKFEGPGETMGKIPKLPKTANDPILRNGGVYPMWGPVCQRYTYHTTYQDKEGRPPEYVRLWFNGKWIEVEKEKPNDNDYKKGVRYVYQFVPNKLDANFFFFEASNGLGKTREGIIDSPGNGPVLFAGDFLDNEIALIDAKTGEKVFRHPTKEEWIGGVALSDDGRYLAAKTSFKIYLFDTSRSNKPLWVYEQFANASAMMIGGDVKGGVDISGDGSKIVASIGDMVLLFDKSSNKPLWQYPAGNAYNVAISKDGQYLAAATAGEESNLNSNLIILWQAKSNKPLWQYHASGNFHDVSLSDDGQFLAGATGCPDRRAYIFSRDSNTPLVRSEMLTFDSPVSRSKITADGSLVAFNTDGGPDSSLIALFSKNSSQPLWVFSEPNQRASRALDITPDGRVMAVANMDGEVYLFGKDSNQPLASWKINASTGALDLADDGSFLAVGGTDNKVHILEVVSKKDTQIAFEEFVEEIDISANGKYVAAGTGGSIYFFESVTELGKVFPCITIRQPPPMDEVMAMSEEFGPGSMPGDAQSELRGQRGSLLLKEFFRCQGKFLIVVFLVIFLATILAFIKWKKWWIWLIFVFLTIGVVGGIWFWLEKMATPTGSIQEKRGETVCGDSLCESDFGETQDNCPRDCSRGD